MTTYNVLHLAFIIQEIIDWLLVTTQNVLHLPFAIQEIIDWLLVTAHEMCSIFHL